MRPLCSLIIILLITGCFSNEKQSQAKTDTPKDDLILGERIDGPANVRDTINGKILFSLPDNLSVDCGQLTNEWYQIGTFLPLTDQQFEEEIIRKGTKVFENDTTLICTALKDVELWQTGKNKEEKYGFIGGYTHQNNIKASSIPENDLEKLLNSDEVLNLAHFKTHFTQFNYDKHGLSIESYKELEQYMIYGSWIEDPSPIDRLRLMFQSDQLIAIIHERDLNMKGKKSYPLVRNQKILIVKDFEKQTLLEFIEKNKRSYNGVD